MLGLLELLVTACSVAAEYERQLLFLKSLEGSNNMPIDTPRYITQTDIDRTVAVDGVEGAMQRMFYVAGTVERRLFYTVDYPYPPSTARRMTLYDTVVEQEMHQGFTEEQAKLRAKYRFVQDEDTFSELVLKDIEYPLRSCICVRCGEARRRGVIELPSASAGDEQYLRELQTVTYEVERTTCIPMMPVMQTQFSDGGWIAEPPLVKKKPKCKWCGATTEYLKQDDKGYYCPDCE